MPCAKKKPKCIIVKRFSTDTYPPKKLALATLGPEPTTSEVNTRKRKISDEMRYCQATEGAVGLPCEAKEISGGNYRRQATLRDARAHFPEVVA